MSKLQADTAEPEHESEFCLGGPIRTDNLPYKFSIAAPRLPMPVTCISCFRRDSLVHPQIPEMVVYGFTFLTGA